MKEEDDLRGWLLLGHLQVWCDWNTTLDNVALIGHSRGGEAVAAAFMSPLPKSAVVFQHFEYPLAAFAAANPAFDPTSLAQIRFVFDRTRVGAIVLDDIGFRD